MTHALTRLFTLAQQHIALLKEGEGAPGMQSVSLVSPEPSRAVIAALYRHWEEHYPEAGAAYWQLRTWGMLTWQPVYLALIGVHGAQLAAPLGALEQHASQGWLSGYRLTGSPRLEGAETAALIAAAANELSTLCDGLATLWPEAPRERMRGELLADTVCVALEFVAPTLPGQPDWRELAAFWLTALGLAPPNKLALSKEGHYVRRRCCLHYRRSDGALCGNCPKSHNSAPPVPKIRLLPRSDRRQATS